LTVDLLDDRNTGEFLILDSLEDVLNLCLDGGITQLWRVIDQSFLAVRTSVSLIGGVDVVILEILLAPAGSIGSCD
jgi:hypothetical protein